MMLDVLTHTQYVISHYTLTQHNATPTSIHNATLPHIAAHSAQHVRGGPENDKSQRAARHYNTLQHSDVNILTHSTQYIHRRKRTKNANIIPQKPRSLFVKDLDLFYKNLDLFVSFAKT